MTLHAVHQLCFLDFKCHLCRKCVGQTPKFGTVLSRGFRNSRRNTYGSVLLSTLSVRRNMYSFSFRRAQLQGVVTKCAAKTLL